MDGWSTVRTDLALEARESIGEKESEIHGVRVEKKYHEDSNVYVTTVIVDTKNGARILGKPMGTYVTLEAPAMTEPEEDYRGRRDRLLGMLMRGLYGMEEQTQQEGMFVLGRRVFGSDILSSGEKRRAFLHWGGRWRKWICVDCAQTRPRFFRICHY